MYSERELISRLQHRFHAVKASKGIGDDTAILDSAPGFSTLFCSDLLVEGTHFHRDTHPPDSIGFKAVAVNVSDIGAMGGVPECCLLSMAVRPDAGDSWIDNLLEGVATACGAFDVELVGGDTASSEKTFIDVAMLGRVPSGRAVMRSGAQPGDGIYVTGTLGASARGLELLKGGKLADPGVARHLYPTPRHAVGQSVRDQATAMIDVSDGLSRDLHHILEASHVSARIDRRLLPLSDGVKLEQALHGGEDYELVITGRNLPDRVDDVPITRIGQIIESSPDEQIWLVTEAGETLLVPAGWQHFV